MAAKDPASTLSRRCSVFTHFFLSARASADTSAPFKKDMTVLLKYVVNALDIKMWTYCCLCLVEFLVEVESGGSLEHFQSGDGAILQLTPQAKVLLQTVHMIQRTV